jgi:hypothetical protein
LRRKFGEVKAGPPSATPDLSYILSSPCLDRALRRVEVVHDLPAEDLKPRQYGPWSDPAVKLGLLPALREPHSWNHAILKRQRKRDQNPHKRANRRSRGVPVEWVLLGVITGLRILAGERPHAFWTDLLFRVCTTGEEEKVMQHVTAYIHLKCDFSTDFSAFTISSHMATLVLRRRGRSH